MPSELKSYRILIADDEPMIRETLRSQLESLGHAVVAEATSGPEAVEKAAEVRPDIAIMDIRMPEGSGIEAAKKMAEEIDCPVVLLTAYSDADTIDSAAAAGAFAFLSKPVKTTDLGPGIEMAIARYKDVRRLETRLRNRTVLDRAKGKLMDKFQLTEEEAHKRIHYAARRQNRTMGEVAEDIIERNLFPD